jgi:molybdenum cofactor cytidylyltransferase
MNPQPPEDLRGSGSVAILLAAGASRRMGRPKPLLPWHGRTLIAYQIGELLAAGVQEVIAVLGAGADAIRPVAEAAGARVALNLDYRAGRAGSIQVGAAAVRGEPAAILLLNVDQPRDRRVSATLLTAHLRAGNLITVPSYLGRRGHPVVLAGRLLPELRGVHEATEGLRAMMRLHAAERAELEIDDPAVLLDLNLPSDYESARLQSSIQIPP